MHSFEILDFCIGNQNHGRWEIILVQLGLLYHFNWCKYILWFCFQHRICYWLFGFLNVWVCLLIIKSLVLMNFNLIVVIYSRIVNLQIFLWLSLYIKEWSLLTTSLPPVSCWRCICSGIYDKLDFSIKKVLNHCVSQSCVVNSTCEFSQTFVKFCATVYCYHVFLC